MQPIKTEPRDGFWVMGLVEQATPDAVDYQAFWGKLGPHMPELARWANTANFYGVYFPTEDREKVDVFAGQGVEGDAEVPAGLVLREVPAATYAVFECALDQIGATWQAIMHQWAPSADHQPLHHHPAFEEYTPGAMSGTDKVRIYLPVQA